MRNLANTFKHLTEDAPSLEEDSLDIDDLEIELESINSDLNIAFSEVETHDRLGQHVEKFGLENIDEFNQLEFYPSLEAKTFSTLLATFLGRLLCHPSSLYSRHY